MPSHWSSVFNPAAPYRWTMLAAIALSVWFWIRKSKKDPDSVPIIAGALGGAFFGAKLVYLFAEGWRDWPMDDRWLRLLTGKSILGGLIGGYAGVECIKRLIGYRQSTGDRFAFIAPLGIAVGRVGCCLQGCCGGAQTNQRWCAVMDANGVYRWPTAQIELLFQLLAFCGLLILAKTGRYKNRLFFLYLATYGMFRFIHEFVRATPTMTAGLSGYQLLAAATAALGVWKFIRRSAVQPMETVRA